MIREDKQRSESLYLLEGQAVADPFECDHVYLAVQLDAAASAAFFAPIFLLQQVLNDWYVLCTLVVSFRGFASVADLEPGARIGMGCWMYTLMGESAVRIYAFSNEKSSYALLGSSETSHHSAAGGAVR